MSGVKMNDVMAQIHDKIKSNPDILKLLYYTDNTINPLEQPRLTLAQAKQVVKNNIYTRKKVMSESDTIQCYISMRYGQKIYHHERNQYFNGNTFNFYVLCHNDYDTNEIIGSRVCEIERLIEEMFDIKEITISTTESHDIKLMMEFLPSSDIDVNGTDYSGRMIQVRFNDCNGKTYAEY